MPARLSATAISIPKGPAPTKAIMDTPLQFVGGIVKPGTHFVIPLWIFIPADL